MGSISVADQELNRTPNLSPVAQKCHSKTLDIGLNGHTASLGPLGNILQLGCYHPTHGMIVACPFAQFDGERFYDSEYVRSYRLIMHQFVRTGTPGFGVNFEGLVDGLKINFVDNHWIHTTYAVGNLTISTTVSITEDGVLMQTTDVKSTSPVVQEVNYLLNLGLSVNRASYGQLTEGGPLLIPASKNDLRISSNGSSWAVRNSYLDAIIEGALFQNDKAVDLRTGISNSVAIGAPVDAKFNGKVYLPPGGSCKLIATFALRPGQQGSPIIKAPGEFSSISRGQWRIKHDKVGLIIKRNLEYILGNCAVPINKDTVCFVADHVALPLGWNRDNYWQIRFLLDVNRNLSNIAYPQTAQVYSTQIRLSIRGHLNWVFCHAQRPHGYWHRSYLTTGVPKDGPVFQQDQQCYPILELCDFFETFPQETEFVGSLLDVIPTILTVLKNHQDPETNLFQTEETPGDDAVEYPFHFSSHVLLWYTLTRLSVVVNRLPHKPTISHDQLVFQAADLRQTILHHFVKENPATGSTMFAYLTDGKGQQTFYHDANDIPTLYIPDWKFSQTREEYGLWKRTMDFGLSTANEGGFYADGPFGGLGSVHTRGPWPLGYAQEFVYANLMNDDVAREDAWRRIQGSMFWDGLFSEAVDARTGDCVSKAWFSWPGSMIGSSLLRFSTPDMTTETVM